VAALGMAAGRTPRSAGPVKTTAVVDGREFCIDLTQPGVVLVDGQPYPVDLESIDGGGHFSLLVSAESHEVFTECNDGQYSVLVGGHRYVVRLEDSGAGRPHQAAGALPDEAEAADVTSAMPGLVVAVLVREGQAVCKGDPLVLLEAMKMENEIRAPVGGVVERVLAIAGQQVGRDDLLVRIRATD
jgi:biotin carboxyl carrier protein